MRNAVEIFNNKAKNNKWLNELTKDEKNLILEMIVEGSEQVVNKKEVCKNCGDEDIFYNTNIGSFCMSCKPF